MSNTKKKVLNVSEVCTLVYVGPTIPGIANHGTAYNNGIPQGLRKEAEKKPLLNKLIVDITDMPEAIRSINRKTGVIYEAYKTVNKEGE